MLLSECADVSAEVANNVTMENLCHLDSGRFALEIRAAKSRWNLWLFPAEDCRSRRIGATGFGYDIARQFELRLV